MISSLIYISLALTNNDTFHIWKTSLFMWWRMNKERCHWPLFDELIHLGRCGRVTGRSEPLCEPLGRLLLLVNRCHVPEIDGEGQRLQFNRRRTALTFFLFFFLFLRFLNSWWRIQRILTEIQWRRVDGCRWALLHARSTIRNPLTWIDPTTTTPLDSFFLFLWLFRFGLIRHKGVTIIKERQPCPYRSSLLMLFNNENLVSRFYDFLKRISGSGRSRLATT